MPGEDRTSHLCLLLAKCNTGRADKVHGRNGFRHGCIQIPRDLKELAILTLSSAPASTPEVSNRKGHCLATRSDHS